MIKSEKSEVELYLKRAFFDRKNMLLYKTRVEREQEQHAYIRISFDVENCHQQVPRVGKLMFMKTTVNILN